MIEPCLANAHILIAEDNPTNQIVVTRMIEVLGGTFDLAKDGVEAIELYEAGKYDIALLDIEMPRKSGLEVIRHIRNDPDTPANFPILALTAFVLGEHKVKIREAGATTIIAKPVADVAEFGRSISVYLKNAPQKSSGHQIEIDGDVLGELKNSLGLDITKDLVKNLDADLVKIQIRLSALSEPVDKDIVRADTHSLLSLAGMAGATGLIADAQNLNNEYDNLSDKELVEASSDIVIQIEELRVYLIEWLKGQNE